MEENIGFFDINTRDVIQLLGRTNYERYLIREYPQKKTPWFLSESSSPDYQYLFWLHAIITEMKLPSIQYDEEKQLNREMLNMAFNIYNSQFNILVCFQIFEEDMIQYIGHVFYDPITGGETSTCNIHNYIVLSMNTSSSDVYRSFVANNSIPLFYFFSIIKSKQTTIKVGNIILNELQKIASNMHDGFSYLMFTIPIGEGMYSILNRHGFLYYIYNRDHYRYICFKFFSVPKIIQDIFQNEWQTLPPLKKLKTAEEDKNPEVHSLTPLPPSTSLPPPPSTSLPPPPFTSLPPPPPHGEPNFTLNSKYKWRKNDVSEFNIFDRGTYVGKQDFMMGISGFNYVFLKTSGLKREFRNKDIDKFIFEKIESIKGGKKNKKKFKSKKNRKKNKSKKRF